MYEDFMTALNISLGPDTSTIWTFSYLGHDTQHPTILPRGETSPDLITIWCDHNFYSSNLHPWGTDRPQTVSAWEISANHHPGHPHRSLYWLQDYHGNFQTQRNSSDQRYGMEDLNKTKSLCQMFTFCSRQLRTWWPHREAKRPFPWSQHGGYQPSWLSCSSVCYLVILLQCWWKKYGWISDLICRNKPLIWYF